MTITDVRPDQATSARTVELTCDLGDLTDALNTVALAVAKRGLTVLTGALIETGPDGATVSAFDYETSVRVALPATVSGAGRVLISHADLVKLVKGAAKGDTVRVWRGHRVTITVDQTTGTRTTPRGVTETYADDHATLSVAGFTMPLTGLPIADYPSLPDRPTGGATFTIDRDTLMSTLDKLKVSAGKDDTLPMFQQMYMRLAGGELITATTDRFQLGEARHTVDTLAGQPDAGPWLLPIEQLHKVVKLLPAGPVTFTLPDRDGHWVSVDAGPISVTVTRDVDNEFPRYERLFPEPSTVVTIARDQLTRAVVKAEAMTTDRSGYMYLRVHADALEVTPGVDSDTARIATGARVTADVSGLVGEPLLIGFTASKLRSALGTFSGDQVEIGFTSTGKPALFTDPTDSGFRHLVMTVRIPS